MLRGKTLSNFFWLWLMVVLSACDRSLPSQLATPTESPTETPIAVPSPTTDWFPATPSPTFVPSQASPISYLPELPPSDYLRLEQDNFTDEELWTTQSSSAGNIAYGSESLAFALSGGSGMLESQSSYRLPAGFYLEVTVEASLCSPDDQYALVFWQNSASGTYRLWANCRGNLKVDRVLPDGVSRIVDWTPARKLQPGAPAINRLGILAQEGSLHFYVNETYQFSLSVRTDLQGGLALAAQTESERAATFIFSDLKIWQP